MRQRSPSEAELFRVIAPHLRETVFCWGFESISYVNRDVLVILQFRCLACSSEVPEKKDKEIR